MNRKKKPTKENHVGKHWPNQPKKPIVCPKCRTFQGHTSTCPKRK